MATRNRFEDRGAAGTAASGPPVRNRGGFNAKPPQGSRNHVAPPPTSRSRQDTVQRQTQSKAPPPSPPRSSFGGDKGKWEAAIRKSPAGGVGPERSGKVDLGRPGMRPMGDGEYKMTGRPSPAGALNRITEPSSPANTKAAGDLQGAAQEGRTELPTAPGAPAMPTALQGAAGQARQAVPPADQPPGASQPNVVPGTEIDDRSQKLQLTGPDGSKIAVEDKGPDREQQQLQQATDLEGELDTMAAATDGGRFKMGEASLGWKIPNSEQDVSGGEWQGELGPGMPANDGGALGVPGGHNTPEDVQFNRQRFDDAARQHDGDHFKAAMSTGSFPSGQPMAQGQKGHAQQIVESSAGDNVKIEALSEPMRRRYKQDAIKQLEDFGAYPGMDDPASPAPPIRPLSHSFNPFTKKWTNPEGSESMLDRFGGGG